jgi:hypothetical protein
MMLIRPGKYVTFSLRFLEYGPVIHPRVHDHSVPDLGLVFFPLLYRTAVPLHVLHGGESLNPLRGDVPIGHGVPDYHGPAAQLPQYGGHPAGRLAFAAPGPDRAHGDHGNLGAEHGFPGAQEPEIRAKRDRPGRLLHHVLVGDVGIGEDNLIHARGIEEPFQIVLRHYGNPLGVQGTGELRGIPAARDIGDLRRGERDDPCGLVPPEDEVEVMEIAPRGAHYDDVPSCHRLLFATVLMNSILGRVQSGKVPGKRDTSKAQTPLKIIIFGLD